MTKQQFDNMIKSYNDSYQRAKDKFGNNGITQQYNTVNEMLEFKGIKLNADGKISRSKENYETFTNNPQLISYFKSNKPNYKEYKKEFEKSVKQLDTFIDDQTKKDILKKYGSLESFYTQTKDFLEEKADNVYEVAQQVLGENASDGDLHQFCVDYGSGEMSMNIKINIIIEYQTTTNKVDKFKPKQKPTKKKENIFNRTVKQVTSKKPKKSKNRINQTNNKINNAVYKALNSKSKKPKKRGKK